MKKKCLDIRFKNSTIARVSFLLGYGFNCREISEMINIANTNVRIIKVQLKEIYKIKIRTTQGRGKNGKESNKS